MDLSVDVMQQIEELSLAVDKYSCYPGELLNIYTRFTCPAQINGELQVILPRVMAIDSFVLPEGVSDDAVSLVEREQELIVLLPMQNNFSAGTAYEVQIKARVNTFYIDQFLLIRSVLLGNDKETRGAESLQIIVYSKGKYLQYLPEIY
ncbi:MAG: hypothetical protein LWX83_17560, partial [Anaerolineae bacterium]|nr:hypothetical protein [Anaerolineae bacterium]